MPYLTGHIWIKSSICLLQADELLFAITANYAHRKAHISVYQWDLSTSRSGVCVSIRRLLFIPRVDSFCHQTCCPAVSASVAGHRFLWVKPILACGVSFISVTVSGCSLSTGALPALGSQLSVCPTLCPYSLQSVGHFPSVSLCSMSATASVISYYSMRSSCVA